MGCVNARGVMQTARLLRILARTDARMCAEQPGTRTRWPPQPGVPITSGEDVHGHCSGIRLFGRKSSPVDVREQSGMSFIHPLAIVGVGTLTGAAAVIVFNVVRSRRARRLQLRRDQLMALARREGLEYVGDRPRSEDLDAAHWFRGAETDASADGFLQGQDRNGRYWIARRKIAGQTQDVLGFHIRGNLSVGTVYFEPKISGAASGGTSWAQRLFSRSAPESTTVLHWTVHRQATAEQILDETARNSIDRWGTRLVTRGKNEGRLPLGLEVSGDRGWVFSTRPLEGARVKDFLEHALDLRAAVLQEVHCRPATISTPVNTVTGESERHARGATQPLFAVDVAEGADLGEESKTVVISAEDLVRDAPVPKPKRKKFKIPEPEEDVEVIWARR